MGKRRMKTESERAAGCNTIADASNDQDAGQNGVVFDKPEGRSLPERGGDQRLQASRRLGRSVVSPSASGSALVCDAAATAEK